MTEISQNNERIAKNTIFLYARMLLLILVSLYTSRLTLQALGVVDYGIYNVVGGVVAMFSILSGSLSAAIQRFITFELGKNSKEKLRIIFATSVNIQIGLALIIMFLAEIGGYWFLNYKMNIDEDRLLAANWVLQSSILAFMINLISIPYNAAIIAHEKMSAFAYISIIEALLKLLIVTVLFISYCDRLILYAVLLTVISLILRVIYGFYCKKNFEECSYKFVYDKVVLKKMAKFAGWNFIGSSAGILRNQGNNILLNLFYGTVVNAAQAVAVQVNSVVYGFVTNFMTALNPQITKSYASGNIEYLNTLLCQGARLSYYLLLLISLPILIETEILLNIWLIDVPSHTIFFVRLVLLTSLVDSLSAPLITAMLATGNIKWYQIIAGGCNMLCFPMSYIFLSLGASPEIPFIIGLGISIILFFLRVMLLRDMFEWNYKRFVSKTVVNIILVTVFSCIIPLLCHFYILNSFLRLIVVVIVSILSCLVVFYFSPSGERHFHI